MSTIAGTVGMAGSRNGIGTQARFSFPAAIATDAEGNLYVADTGNDLIRKITFRGRIATVETLAGGGNDPTARFNAPFGVARDLAGNVYVADALNNTIRKIAADGTVDTIAGSASEHYASRDGSGADARLDAPHGIAIDPAGNMYIADTNNHTIRQITLDGRMRTIAGTAGLPGDRDGIGAIAQFRLPVGIAVDLHGNVYVADSNNHTIRKITFPNGVATVETFAGRAGQADFRDDVGAAARFHAPSGIATDTGGNVYVADTVNNVIREISGDATVRTIADRLNRPMAVTVDPTGNMYVADTISHTIRKIIATV